MKYVAVWKNMQVRYTVCYTELYEKNIPNINANIKSVEKVFYQMGKSKIQFKWSEDYEMNLWNSLVKGSVTWKVNQMDWTELFIVTIRSL